MSESIPHAYISSEVAQFRQPREKLGIIFACGPALRQLYGYYKRVGTIKPTKNRQNPEQDFVKMRGRITWRDIFWYTSNPSRPSKRQISNDRPTTDSQSRKIPEEPKRSAAALFQGVSKPESGDRDVEAAFQGHADRQTQKDVVADEAHASRFTLWKRKFGSMFRTSNVSQGSTEMSNNPRRKTSRRNLLGNQTSEGARDTTFTQMETDRLHGRYRDWGILHARNDEKNNKKGTFLASQSAGQSAIRTQTEPEGDTPGHDHELADILTQPVASPAAMLKK